MRPPPTQQPAPENDERRIAALLDSYFVEPSASSWQSVSTTAPPAAAPTTHSQYPSPASIVAKYSAKNKVTSPDKKERDKVKRAKQAEAARLRFVEKSPPSRLQISSTLGGRKERIEYQENSGTEEEEAKGEGVGGIRGDPARDERHPRGPRHHRATPREEDEG